MTKNMAVIVGVALTLLLPSLATGQDAAPVVNGICGGACMSMGMMMSPAPCFQPPMPGEHHHGGGKMFARRRARLEKLRMEKMIEVLNLSPEQRDKMVELMKQHREQQEQLFAERGRLMEQMRKVVHSDPFDEQAAKELIGKYEELEKRQFEHRGALIREVKGLLTTEQQARLILFQENFEANIMQAIRGLRDSAGKGPGGPDDNGPPPPRKGGDDDN